MDADEIRVVLARASELHAKFNEAIERALTSDVVQSTGDERFDADFHSVLDGDEINGFERLDRDFSKGVEGNAEARTLGLICDTLDTLEGQLEALQCMQNHQRAEKDAALAELEESRHLLLLKLKNHRGREWQVVQEALAFAGEPVEEREDLLLPPYSRPVVDDVSTVNDQSSKLLRRTISLPRGRAVKKLVLSERDEEVDNDVHRNKGTSEAVGDKQDYQERSIPKHKVDGGGSIAFAGGFMRGFGGRVGHVLAHAAKAVFVVASVVAFLAFTEHNHRRPVPSATTPVLVSESRPRPPSPLKCSPGKKRIVLDDGSEKCVVKERFEVPFCREVEAPYVLYGPG